MQTKRPKQNIVMKYTPGKKLGNTNFYQICFHVDSCNRKAMDKTRKIISPL